VFCRVYGKSGQNAENWNPIGENNPTDET
jgi:hypothetical protein